MTAPIRIPALSDNYVWLLPYADGKAAVELLGFETIDLPAGRFVDACRIETRSTESGTTTTVTDWYANGTGALLKSRANDGSETVVTALSIDGRLLAGQFVTVASGAGSTSGAGTGGAKR